MQRKNTLISVEQEPCDVVCAFKKITPGVFRHKHLSCRMGETIEISRRALGSFVDHFVCLSTEKEEARLPNNVADKAAPSANDSTAAVTEGGEIEVKRKHMYEIVLLSRGQYNVVNKVTGKLLNTKPLSKKEAGELFNDLQE